MGKDTTPGLVDICKDFARAMSRAEQAIQTAGPGLSKEERQRQLGEFFQWLEKTEEIPATGLTREVARELVGQLTAFLAYADYRGSTDAYIQ
jgi:hypothetical protein